MTMVHFGEGVAEVFGAIGDHGLAPVTPPTWSPRRPARRAIDVP